MAGAADHCLFQSVPSSVVRFKDGVQRCSWGPMLGARPGLHVSALCSLVHYGSQVKPSSKERTFAVQGKLWERRLQTPSGLAWQPWRRCPASQRHRQTQQPATPNLTLAMAATPHWPALARLLLKLLLKLPHQMPLPPLQSPRGLGRPPSALTPSLHPLRRPDQAEQCRQNTLKHLSKVGGCAVHYSCCLPGCVA